MLKTVMVGNHLQFSSRSHTPTGECGTCTMHMFCKHLRGACGPFPCLSLSCWAGMDVLSQDPTAHTPCVSALQWPELSVFLTSLQVLIARAMSHSSLDLLSQLLSPHFQTPTNHVSFTTTAGVNVQMERSVDTWQGSYLPVSSREVLERSGRAFQGGWVRTFC